MIDAGVLLLILPFMLVLLMTGLFAGIEAAFVAANRFTFELKNKQGIKSGVVLSELLEEPSKFVSALAIGFTIFLVAYGLLVGSILSPVWDWIVASLETSYTNIKYVRLVFETFTSGLLLLFVIIAFRATFRAKSDSVLSILAGIGMLGVIQNIFYPIASTFISLADWILKVFFDIKTEQKPVIAAVDIDQFIQQTKDQSDDSEDMNAQLFENALQLPSIKIRQCLVPRKEIVATELNTPVRELRTLLADTKLSRIVVYDKNIDNIVGYVHQIALFKNPADIQSILMPIPAVPESMSATDLISKLTKERKSIAWVVDEFGGTAGVITLEDLLEEIFGEIRDEYDTDKFVEKQISENEYIFSGRLKIDFLREKYDLDFGATDAETLSGYIITHHETIPKIKERIIIGHFEFDIVSVGDTRIEMVKLKRLK